VAAKISYDGNGVCRKKPIFSDGMPSRSIAGSSINW
jgi:hypothetical protein